MQLQLIPLSLLLIDWNMFRKCDIHYIVLTGFVCMIIFDTDLSNFCLTDWLVTLSRRKETEGNKSVTCRVIDSWWIFSMMMIAPLKCVGLNEWLIPNWSTDDDRTEPWQLMARVSFWILVWKGLITKCDDVSLDRTRRQCQESR